MGTIYKRGRNYWIQYCKNGQVFRESAKSSKKMVATQLLKQREGAIAVGKTPAILFEKVKFDDLAEFIRTDYKINNKKLEGIDKRLKHLKPFFGGVSVQRISSESIENYIKDRLSLTCKECGCKIENDALKNGKCPFCKKSKDFEPGALNGTINRELAALKRMLNLGRRKGKVDRMPYFPMLKGDNVRKGFFEHAEFVALRDALPDYLKGFATFGYRTGWRISEIAGLTWAQVDLDNGIVRLESGETKNDQGRTIYLDNKLKEVISNQWKKRKKKGKPTPFVFPNKNGTGQIRDMRDAWARACKKAKIGKRLFHDFRRTAVRNMVRSGIPERVAMMISGHKTRSVFERYNIVNDRDLQLAAQSQEAYLNLQSDTKMTQVVDFEEKRKNRNVA